LKLSLFLLSVLFVLAAFPLAAQEYLTETEAQEQESLTEAEAQDVSDDQAVLSEDDRLYVITAFEFDIKGRTRPSALIYKGEFKIGETLQGQENLDEYIRDKTQILVNQRILKDNALVTYSVGEQSEDGSYPVTLTISTEDSWNIIALPRPYYKSDRGFDLSIRARDYNFLGTMNPLRINLGYKYDEEKRSSFQFDILSNIPFNALGYHWEVKFNNYFNYRQNQPFFYQNISGLSVEMPFRKTTFTFSFEEATILNEENADVYKLSTGLGEYPDFQNGLYMSSRLAAAWKIPTGLFVSRYGELTYIPVISATFNHELPRWELQEIRRGPSMGFVHSLYFEKIDWHANFREGISTSISNGYGYNFYTLRHEGNPLSASLAFSTAGHFIISKFFGISSRLQYRHWFYFNDPKYYDSASDALRGIADKKISADYMLSLNTDFPFHVLSFTPSEWFKNRKLRFFDFELHASPVIDLALYHDPRTATSFHPKNIAASGGLEFIFFPAFMRNFIVRLGYACNLREFLTARPVRLPRGDDYELYFIMGHHY
jgi:hypothetical protein